MKKQGLDYHQIHKVCIKLGKKCDKCGHQFATKAMLQYHLNNKVCINKQLKKEEPSKVTLIFSKAFGSGQIDHILAKINAMFGHTNGPNGPNAQLETNTNVYINHKAHFSL